MGEEEKEDMEDQTQTPPVQPQRQTRIDDPTDRDCDINLPWADSIEEKEEDTTRFYFKNVHGCSAANDFAEAAEIGYQADSDRVDVLCLAEPNLYFNTHRNKQGVKSHIECFYKQMKMVTACSPINYASTYQPGGVATVVTGN